MLLYLFSSQPRAKDEPRVKDKPIPDTPEPAELTQLSRGEDPVTDPQLREDPQVKPQVKEEPWFQAHT